VTIVLSPSPAFSAGAFTVNVRVEQHASPKSEAPCAVAAGRSCSLLLEEAIALVGSNQWQRNLPEEVDTVRLLLAGDTFRVGRPMMLRWGGDTRRRVLLEILGEKGRTRISGGAIVSDWKQAEARTTPARLRARVSALVADLSGLPLPFSQSPLPRGYGHEPQPVLTEVFVGDVPLVIASWPNDGFGEVTQSSVRQQDEHRIFSVKSRQVADWHDEPDLMAHAFWKNDWAAQAYLVGLKDTKKNRMHLIGSGSPYGIAGGQRIRIENALAELDAPGEWYVDRASGMLYMIPLGKKGEEAVEVSVSSSILSIERSQDVRISGIQFDKTRGDAIRVFDSRNILFEHVAIRGTGNRALVIKDSRDSGIRSSVIEDAGEGGVYISGGDRKTLTPAHNFVEHCTIQRFSRLVKTMGFGVELHGVGHRVSGNRISDAPHSAVLFSGNDHIIEENTIFDVVKETSDAGAIYVGRDFTVHGTLIARNLLRDIRPFAPGREVKGIYIDDQASGITIKKNIFARVQQPVFIGGGRDNVVEDNLFFRSSPIVRLDARGLESQRAQIYDPTSTLSQRLAAVPYNREPFLSRFPNLARLQDDDYGAPKYNVFRKNIVIDSQDPVVSDRARMGITIQGNRNLTEDAFEKYMVGSDRKERVDFKLRLIRH
jgi:hypothetical protein